MGFWIQLAIAVVLSVVSYALAPKPSRTASPQSQDLRDPTAEAGKPIPVLFGEMMVTSPNVLFYGDVSKNEYEVNA